MILEDFWSDTSVLTNFSSVIQDLGAVGHDGCKCDQQCRKDSKVNTAIAC